MRRDALGFLRPAIENALCVSCMSCDRVCPSLNDSPEDSTKEVWWAQSDDIQLLAQSSSGGVFGLLANRVLASNGVVCGAAWSEGCRSVRHILVTTEGELDSLRRSKYVQSVMGTDVYVGVRDAIRDGKPLLFVGTACQVSAMRAYLGKLADSPLFLSADVVCHGVPSPRLWEMWLDHLSDVHSRRIDGVNFRSKSTGWPYYSVAYYSGAEIVSEARFTEDWFYETFQANASLRDSCLKCPSKRSCGSDITLGDFWGFQDLHPEIDCSGGMSAVICNTDKGCGAFSSLLSLSRGPATFDDVLRQNRSLTEPSVPYAQRDAFLSEVAGVTQMRDIINRWRFNLTARGRVRRELARAKRSIVYLARRWFRRLLLPYRS